MFWMFFEPYCTMVKIFLKDILSKLEPVYYDKERNSHRYVKLPVEIDAWQLTVENFKNGVPSFIDQETISFILDDDKPLYASIDTLEGTMKANINDWIIKGIRGEFYPCKSDVFNKTYIKA